ncbi:MAG TPA: hypothetical protein PKH93_09180 [Chitinophagales bacterium]|nr:hypothetical protein [Chitinophagales bacterium]
MNGNICSKGLTFATHIGARALARYKKTIRCLVRVAKRVSDVAGGVSQCVACRSTAAKRSPEQHDPQGNAQIIIKKKWLF